MLSTITCPRCILRLVCSTSRMNQRSMLAMVSRNQDLGTGCAHNCWGAPATGRSQWAVLGNIYLYFNLCVYISVSSPVWICVYKNTYMSSSFCLWLWSSPTELILLFLSYLLVTSITNSEKLGSHDLHLLIYLFDSSAHVVSELWNYELIMS